MIHVALLRGINVGGRHAVPMAGLRRVVAGLGATDVRTWINSGNVVFALPGTDDGFAGRLESAVAGEFDVTCRVLVRTGDHVRAIAAAIPAEWGNGPDAKADVVYLFDGIDPAGARDRLAPRDGIDNVVLAPGALIWMVERANASRNGLLRMVGTDLYRASTVRNVNTARRLAQMVDEVSPAR
jgi:uncharacterized protein (DUF1697 family)